MEADFSSLLVTFVVEIVFFVIVLLSTGGANPDATTGLLGADVSVDFAVAGLELMAGMLFFATPKCRGGSF